MRVRISRSIATKWVCGCLSPSSVLRGSVVKEIPFDAEFGGFRSGFDDVALGTYNDYAEISNRIEGSE